MKKLLFSTAFMFGALAFANAQVAGKAKAKKLTAAPAQNATLTPQQQKIKQHEERLKADAILSAAPADVAYPSPPQKAAPSKN